MISELGYTTILRSVILTDTAITWNLFRAESVKMKCGEGNICFIVSCKLES